MALGAGIRSDEFGPFDVRGIMTVRLVATQEMSTKAASNPPPLQSSLRQAQGSSSRSSSGWDS